MALIDLDDVKLALGVGDYYTDTDLQKAADAAEAVLLPLLAANRAHITSYVVQNDTVRFATPNGNAFNVGDDLTLTDCRDMDGEVTVTARNGYSFTAAAVGFDDVLYFLKPYGVATVTADLTRYDTNPNVREAALMLVVDIWNARVSASGTANAVTMLDQPQPYRMGRSILSRVMGLIGSERDPGSMVG